MKQRRTKIIEIR